MAHEVSWNRVVLDEFFRLSTLTDEEKQIMELRVHGYPRSYICDSLGISLSTLDRLIVKIKHNYDAVQPFSGILPVRIKKSAAEEWMDTH